MEPQVMEHDAVDRALSESGLRTLLFGAALCPLLLTVVLLVVT